MANNRYTDHEMLIRDVISCVGYNLVTSTSCTFWAAQLIVYLVYLVGGQSHELKHYTMCLPCRRYLSCNRRYLQQIDNIVCVENFVFFFATLMPLVLCNIDLIIFVNWIIDLIILILWSFATLICYKYFGPWECR